MTIIEKLRKGINNPQKAFSAVSYTLLSMVGKNDYRRFIVLSRSRTGSNLLISLLNSHPHIAAEGEIFGKLNGKNYKTVLAKAFSKQPYYIKIKAKGFKIFYYHPQDNNSCGVWEELQSMSDLYVIHLKRKNILRTLLSRKVAGIQDVWSVRSDQPSSARRKKISVSFTVDELRKGFKQTIEWEKDGDSKFQNHPLLSVSYEDLANDLSNTFRKVTKFLGVQFAEPKTRLKKQNTGTLREMIRNYDELKSAFADTEWAPFFEE